LTRLIAADIPLCEITIIASSNLVMYLGLAPLMSDVQAMVIENLGVSLLGQSFLTRLDGYEMRDGVLTITWN
jgi:hypothetical protein